MDVLTIGQVAKRAGVNLETIRYYERRGLLPAPPRQTSGYRQYTPDVVARVRFIKGAQELGFSLNEIHELLSLRVEAVTVCSEVQQRAEAKVAEIEQKIETLQRIKQILTDLVQHCRTKEPTAACPILAALDDEASGPAEHWES
jgi:Hg(II)-responsive transcriptional regulator